MEILHLRDFLACIIDTFLILGLVVLHIWALHVPGNNNPIGIELKKPSKDTVPFHPYIVIKDLFALLIFLIIFAFFVFYSPNILGHADNYIVIVFNYFTQLSIAILCNFKISAR